MFSVYGESGRQKVMFNHGFLWLFPIPFHRIAEWLRLGAPLGVPVPPSAPAKCPAPCPWARGALPEVAPGPCRGSL